MRTRRLALACLLAGLLALLLLLFWQPVLVHISQETGASNEASRAYAFWSGFGSDLGEITLVTGVVLAWRHHNCHVSGCWRLGKEVDGTPYLACPRHHPAHQGDHRKVSLQSVHEAFERRRR